MRNKSNGLIAGVFLIFFLFSAFAQESEKRTVRMGVFPFHPMTFMDEGGIPQGLYVDLIREIAKSEGWAVEFVFGSWAECMENLEQGRIDLLPCVAWNTQREQVMDFSHESVFELWGQVFVRPGSEIWNVADLEGLSVAVMARDISGENFINAIDQLGISCRILEYASHFDVLQAVADHKVAGGVTPQFFGLIHAKKYDLVPSLIQFSPFSLYFSTLELQNGDLLASIDRYMSRWKRNGDSFYYQQLKHWTEGAYQTSVMPLWAVIAIAAVFFAFILILLWSRALRRQVVSRTRELEEQGRLYRELVESAVNIIMILDLEGRFTFINRYGLDFFGYSREEILGKTILETIIPREDGVHGDVKIWITDVYTNPSKYEFNENINVCRDGREVWMQWSNRPIYDSRGAHKETLCIGTDMTGRKKLEGELLQARKMEALGTLAGGIAHDFNNILTAIIGYSELALSKKEDPPYVGSCLNQVLVSSERARELVNQILLFSRKTASQKVNLRMDKQVEETVSLLKSTLPAAISLKTRLESKSLVYADSIRIHQIVMNLCTNAGHSMEGLPGELEITVLDRRIPAEDPLLNELELTPGDYVCLSVRDTGQGIEPGIMSRIFEPYYTTKEKGKGTGLGLSVVHGIVKDHGGGIKIISQMSRGTRVEVYFPISRDSKEPDGDEDIDKADKTGHSATGEGKNECLLLVDDEASIGSSFAQILRQHGYRVLSFINPREALDAFSKNPMEFDLMLTDMTMPEMTGLQLAGRIFELRPGFPVILWSGYNEFLRKDKILETGIRTYLEKPVTRDRLLKAIRESLDAPV